MTVTVYVWGAMPHDHASVAFGRSYLSFHPVEGTTKFKAMDAFVESDESDLDDDHEKYGYPAAQVTLNHLNEEEMQHAYKLIQQENYNFFENNCSTVVATVLKAGFGRQSVLDEAFQRVWRNVASVYTRPWNHASFLEHADDVVTRSIEIYYARARRGGALAAALVASVVEHEVVARPGDVLALARYYKFHEEVFGE